MTTGHRFAAAVLVAVMLGGFAMAAPAKVSKPSDWNEPEHIRAILSFAENEAGLPRGLAHCVAYSESRFKPTAMSRVVDGYRSCGLMQLYRRYIVANVSRHSSHPETFNWKDPQDNAEVGCRYLSYLIRRFDGSVYLGVLAYNWGETNVRNMKSWDDVPPHCRKYADNVLSLLDAWNEEW